MRSTRTRAPPAATSRGTGAAEVLAKLLGGVVGDAFGTGDDSDALQQSLDALVAKGGGMLQLEARTYNLDKALRVNRGSSIQIRGEGVVTALVATTSNSDGLIIFEGGSSFCGVYDLVVKNSAAQPAISVVGQFWVELKQVHFMDNWMALLVDSSNTVTLEDCLVVDVRGPAAISVGAAVGKRVDIFQATRITANQISPGVNDTVIWIHVGQGVNTVRLDNVGLINGGNGVRFDADWPVGQPTVGGQDPLFLFANDLELDFPKGDCIDLQRGRVANCVNCYIQGSKQGHGIHVGRGWTAEVQISNSRISGHAGAGIFLEGGRHVTIVGNIIADNSLGGLEAWSGVEIGAFDGCDGLQNCVQNVVVSGNRIGAVQSDLPGGPHDPCNHAYGVRVHRGVQNVVISSNLLSGNRAGGVHDETDPPNAVVGLNSGDRATILPDQLLA